MPDSQTLGLVIAGSIAGLICLRLFWVLGRRTGEEPPPSSKNPPTLWPRPRLGNTADTPADVQADAPPPVAGGNGLLDIQTADPGFDTAKFLTGARDAYARIIEAFAKGDRGELASLVSPDVLAAFQTAITARGVEPAPTFVRLTDARITQAALHGRHAEITLAFRAEFASGNVTDVWSFARDLDSSDPNWTLVATSGDLPD